MILALNTSLRDLHIGLFSDDANSLAKFHQNALPDDRGIHDALLAKETSELLKKIAASAKDISKIAIIIGPGSFTGLRIGLSFAKGLAFGSGAEIIPLIAHTVLLEGYKKDHAIAEETIILYPGYESHKTYISYGAKPEEINYVSLEELEGMRMREIICPPELEKINLSHTVIPIDLKVMAEMAIADEKVVSLSNLEPYYGTDFKTSQ
jgi:tRNA threonylcarbamoyl adenosine modification protein YeaZ